MASSIWNCSTDDVLLLLTHLRHKFPKGYGKQFTVDEAGDLVILEDFDASVTEAVIQFRRSGEKR